jgi:hypothetical protein
MRSSPQLDQVRLEARLEHLMTEILTTPAMPVRHAAPRRFPIRRAILAGATIAVTAIAVTVAVSLTGGPTGHGPTAFAVEPLADGTVAISVVNSDVSAHAMTTQLHAAGLRINVTTMTASRQLVGTWVGSGATGDVPAAVSAAIAAQTVGYAATIDVPKAFTGTITLTVGVPTKPGAEPNVSGLHNALAPAGLLACLNLSGADPAAAAATLADKGYTVTWTTRIGPNTPTVSAPPVGSRVAAAFIDDTHPRAVRLIVTSPTDRRYPHLLQLGFPLSQRTADGVTPTC